MKIHKEVEADMERKDYINAQELSIRLGISTSRAYRIIRQLNDELKENGNFLHLKLKRSYKSAQNHLQGLPVMGFQLNYHTLLTSKFNPRQKEP